MSKIYIRESAKPTCVCGSGRHGYSLIQDKKVRTTICQDCYKMYVDNLKGFELIFLTFDSNSRLPTFLKRI